MGLPIEPPICSQECWDEAINNIPRRKTTDKKECLDCVHAASNDNDELVCMVDEKHVIVADDYCCDRFKEVGIHG
ncbi:hypothetical protein D3C76_1776720 [compost metagenome]